MKRWQSNANGNKMFFLKDHLGSVRAVVSEAGTAVQNNDNYPYGDLFEEMAADPEGSANRFLFTGKELCTETGLYDFSARFLNTMFGRFTTLDPLAETMYNKSPYIYCSSNPVNRIDSNGMWDIKVSASENRGKHPFAEMVVSDRHGNVIYKTIVKVTGTHRNRNIKDGDTPVGEYKILEWRKTGNNRYSTSSYGPNDLLALEYIGEEGKGRSSIHLHGGGNQEYTLKGTLGCIRINNDDISELKTITEQLEQSDPNEFKGILTVNNDLESPVEYEDRESTKDNWERYLGELAPAYVIN